MAPERELLADFVSGHLRGADLARVVSAADVELIRALEDLTPLRAALSDPEVRADSVLEFLRGENGLEVTVAGDVTAHGEGGLSDADDPYIGEIRSVLRELCPSECSIAGAAAVEHVARGGTEFGTAIDGDYLDTSDAIAVLESAVGLVSQLLELRQDLVLATAAGIDETELQRIHAGRLQRLNPTEVFPGRRRRIVERVLQRRP